MTANVDATSSRVAPMAVPDPLVVDAIHTCPLPPWKAVTALLPCSRKSSSAGSRLARKRPARTLGLSLDGVHADYALRVCPLTGSAADNVATCRQSDTLERTLIKVHVLQVDQDPENVAELAAGVAAGRTVDDWQMPKGSRPGDLVIWYAAGRQQYIARGWVDAIPTEVRQGPGPYRGAVARMERIEPVDRRKVIRDCGFDGGIQSYQTVADEFVVDFLKSLGLSGLTPRLKVAQLCPTCHQVMPLTEVCDNCG
jgi:hypothetical protein